MNSLGKRTRKGYEGISAWKFNQTYPIGTEIRYYPVTGQPKFEVGKTTTEAWELGHGEPVVTTDIMGGGLSLANIEVI